ncbi:MAG: RHS repeat-associated protein [Parvicellaceae bacterium]
MGCLKLSYQSDKEPSHLSIVRDEPKRGNNSFRTHRYAFQGQEKDDEVKGKGNSYNYSFRMHDSRLGRFFAVKIASVYPDWSPYIFAGNQVIAFNELEGLQVYFAADGRSLGKFGISTEIRIVSKEMVAEDFI